MFCISNLFSEFMYITYKCKKDPSYFKAQTSKNGNYTQSVCCSEDTSAHCE